MPHDRPLPPARPTARLRVLGLLSALVLLTGCGLRLETDPPPPLVPDTAEEARQRTVADAVELGSTARLAAEARESAASADDPNGPDEAGRPARDDVTDLLIQVAEAADAHVAALGGVYDPGTADDDRAAVDDQAEDDPGPGIETAPVPTADDVADLLRDTAVAARADALTVDDGALARLLAAIAIHRQALAEPLGGTPPDEEPETVAESDEATDDATDDGPADHGRAPDGPESTTGEGPTTTADLDILADLVRAEDAAGQAWEVAAARRTDEARAEAAARAAGHRDVADRWAEAAGLVGPDDPRLADYAVPSGPGADGTADDVFAAPTALAALERDLAARYLALLAAEGADSGARARLLDAATDAVVVAHDLDGALDALPGMPEQRP